MMGNRAIFMAALLLSPGIVTTSATARVAPSTGMADRSSAFLLVFRSSEGVHDVWGDLRTFVDARHPLGTEETDPRFHRGPSIGALSNAEFTTPVFVVPKEPLRLNVDALHGTAALTQGAYVMVEVLTPNGQVIPGFEHEANIIGDVNALDYPLAWHGVASTKLQGLEVALRFYIRDARVYALHTQSYPEKALDRLVLSVEDTKLKPWDTTTLALRGEAKDGSFVSLDKKKVKLHISAPNLVIAKTDKRDIHKGYLTVFEEINQPQTVEIRADVYQGLYPQAAAVLDRVEFEHISRSLVRSNLVTLEISPLTTSFKSSDFKMLFMLDSDLVNPVGPIIMEANSLRYYADTRGLPTTPKSMVVFNRKIGNAYHVWGSSRGQNGHIFRATTTDGMHFDTKQVITSMHPQHFMTLVYSPVQDKYIAFEREYPKWHLHTSTDGWTFEYQGIPYTDHDGTHLAWDPLNNQYLSYNLTFQRFPELRKYPDNLGAVNYLGGRRVFSRRTSPDGMHWVPDNRVKQPEPDTWVDSRYLMIVPDEKDPVDMELYWMDAFWYGDRYVALLMSYAPSPPEVLETFPYDPYPSKHAPHMKVEWAFSKDLKHWVRPYRDVHATTDWRIYFANAPMLLHDRIMFVTSNQLYNYHEPPSSSRENSHHFTFDGGAIPGQNVEIYSLPLDRIASAGSRSEAAFSTKPFTMPADPLYVNVDGRVQVEVLDEQGHIIPGYEHDRSAIETDALHHKLEWQGRDTSVLSGQTASLRFYIDDASVYSIHTYTR